MFSSLDYKLLSPILQCLSRSLNLLCYMQNEATSYSEAKTGHYKTSVSWLPASEFIMREVILPYRNECSF